MTNLEELLERVKAYDGTDEALEGEIYNALIGVNADDAKEWYGDGRSVLNSIDAALALAERVLGHAATINLIIDIGSVQHSCLITLFENPENPFVAESYRTPPLAILAATLTAIIAQGEEK